MPTKKQPAKKSNEFKNFEALARQILTPKKDMDGHETKETEQKKKAKKP